MTRRQVTGHIKSIRGKNGKSFTMKAIRGGAIISVDGSGATVAGTRGPLGPGDEVVVVGRLPTSKQAHTREIVASIVTKRKKKY